MSKNSPSEGNMIDVEGECARQKARRSTYTCGCERILLCLEDTGVGRMMVSMKKFWNGKEEKYKKGNRKQNN